VGDTVFDGYAGSGTTAVACLQEQRKFMGSELDSNWYGVSMERINAEIAGQCPGQ